MASIKVNTGSVRYTIEDEDGEILAEIKFCPTDTGIASRLEPVAEKFSKMLNEVEESGGDIVKLAERLNKTIREQFDFLIGRPVSNGLFSAVQPLTILEDGSLFFFSVFEQIAKAIGTAYDQRTQKMVERINAATAGYDDD